LNAGDLVNSYAGMRNSLWGEKTTLTERTSVQKYNCTQLCRLENGSDKLKSIAPAFSYFAQAFHDLAPPSVVEHSRQPSTQVTRVSTTTIHNYWSTARIFARIMPFRKATRGCSGKQTFSHFARI
jgi:hypothetical protein